MSLFNDLFFSLFHMLWNFILSLFSFLFLHCLLVSFLQFSHFWIYANITYRDNVQFYLWSGDPWSSERLYTITVFTLHAYTKAGIKYIMYIQPQRLLSIILFLGYDIWEGKMETTDSRHNGTVERTDHIKLQSVVMVGPEATVTLSWLIIRWPVGTHALSVLLH